MKSSPDAIAIAGFTFVVAVLIGGWQQIHMLAVASGLLPGDPGGAVAVLLALAVDVPVVLAAAGAVRAAAVATAAWVRAFGQATVPLAGLIVLASLIYVTGSFAGSPHGFFYPRM